MGAAPQEGTVGQFLRGTKTEETTQAVCRRFVGRSDQADDPPSVER